MVLICEKDQILYLAPPKTGSVTVIETLERSPYCGVRQDQVHAHHNTVWEARFYDWFIFMTTRHPYTRAASFWQFVQRRIRQALPGTLQWHDPKLNWWSRAYRGQVPDFYEFWEQYPLPQHRNTIWRASWHLEQIPRKLNSVLHQENLAQELATIPIFQGKDLGWKNQAPSLSCPWHAHYTPDLIARVHEYWGQDFAAFGYNPDFEACVRGEFFTQTSPG
jgi:hypothetical protein